MSENNQGLLDLQASCQFQIEQVQVPAFQQTLASRGYEVKSAEQLNELIDLASVLERADTAAKEAGADQVTQFYRLAKEAALIESGVSPGPSPEIQTQLHVKIADALIAENPDVFNSALALVNHQMQSVV